MLKKLKKKNKQKKVKINKNHNQKMDEKCLNYEKLNSFDCGSPKKK